MSCSLSPTYPKRKSHVVQYSFLGLGLHHCSLWLLLPPNRKAQVFAKKQLLFASAIAAVLLTPSLRADESLKLKGTQVQKALTIVRSTSPYLVTGTYEVPPESELIIEAGTKLLFVKDAALNIRGTLLIKGNEKAPVELTGKATGVGSWQGVRINRSNSTQIGYAPISGAKNGIYMHASKPSIDNTILVNNMVGLYVGEYGGGSEPVLKNCLITQNREDGVVLRVSSAAFERCTISRNGGWGIRGEYYASPSISSSIISDNKKGGIWCKLYTCKPEAHDSIFVRNGEYEVFNESPEIWDFSRKWWAPNDSQTLKSKGDTANLRSIRDGRDRDAVGLGEVVLSGFLEAEPTNCGSSLSLGPR
jgi:Right handed beta helix region